MDAVTACLDLVGEELRGLDDIGVRLRWKRGTPGFVRRHLRDVQLGLSLDESLRRECVGDRAVWGEVVVTLVGTELSTAGGAVTVLHFDDTALDWGSGGWTTLLTYGPLSDDYRRWLIAQDRIDSMRYGDLVFTFDPGGTAAFEVRLNNGDVDRYEARWRPGSTHR